MTGHSRPVTASALIAMAFAACAFPATVSAERDATATERAGIARALKIPPRCTVAMVSSIDRRYAAAEPKASSSCRRFASNTQSGLRRSGARWKVVGGTNCESGPLSRMPRRIAREFAAASCEP
jgi:hypothetical protein